MPPLSPVSAQRWLELGLGRWMPTGSLCCQRPGDASPAGVSFVPNCNRFPPTSLPPAVSHPGGSEDVSWGAGPPSWGERETWSLCQHFGNSPAFERDLSARGWGDAGMLEQREGRGLILIGLLVFVITRCRACCAREPVFFRLLREGQAKGACGVFGGWRGCCAKTSANEVAINYPNWVVH